MKVAMPRQRADLPTLVMHWGLVLALLTSVSTGWRMASLHQSHALWRWVDALLLQGNVVRWHFFSASALAALVAAYVAFLWRMQLGARLALRLAALRSPDRATRWQALNRLVYWIALALLALATATGLLLYFAPGLLPTEGLAALHQWVSWGVVGYIGLHVVAQIALGGPRQLLKIMTPRMAYGVGAVAALSAGLASAAVAYLADNSVQRQLTLVRASRLPQLDGEAGDAAWGQANEAVVHTSRGFNLRGGEVDVHVRALHDGETAYFLFRWPDATRSQKHIPLIKTAGGWKLVHSNYFKNDENDYYEDKFAVMLARSPIAGGDTVRLGPQPLPGMPGPSNGLGLHATLDGSLADVWHWKSVRSGALHQFDDNFFGPPLPVRPGRYTGGYTQDPKTAGGFDQNFAPIEGSPYVTLKYLPRDLAAQQAHMGRFDPDVNVSDAGRYAMDLSDVQPYSAQLDAKIPIGTVIPSVVVDKPFEGDRGDVAAFAQWKDGWWTLEARRKLDTGSSFDQPIAEGMFMWVSVFDHNQVRHTRHVQPLRLHVE